MFFWFLWVHSELKEISCHHSFNHFTFPFLFIVAEKAQNFSVVKTWNIKKIFDVHGLNFVILGEILSESLKMVQNGLSENVVEEPLPGVYKQLIYSIYEFIFNILI